MFLSDTGECLEVCPLNYFVTGDKCFKCHSSCKECSGPSPQNCTACSESLVLTTSKTCSATCDIGEFMKADKSCEKCHESCLECSDSGSNHCISCKNKEVSRLSVNGSCPNCLMNPEIDRDTCKFSVPIQLVAASARSINLRASTTVKLSFAEESTYYKRLSEQILRSKLDITVEGISSDQYLTSIRFEQGEILIDLYFKETKEGLATMKAYPTD